MDNLDEMIVNALSQTIVPDAELVNSMIILSKQMVKKDNSNCLVLVMLCNICMISLIVAFTACFASPQAQIFVYFYCITWASALLPVYLLASEKFKKGCIK